jgi:hypothetical protein
MYAVHKFNRNSSFTKSLSLSGLSHAEIQTNP